MVLNGFFGKIFIYKQNLKIIMRNYFDKNLFQQVFNSNEFKGWLLSKRWFGDKSLLSNLAFEVKVNYFNTISEFMMHFKRCLKLVKIAAIGQTILMVRELEDTRGTGIANPWFHEFKSDLIFWVYYPAVFKII